MRVEASRNIRERDEEHDHNFYNEEIKKEEEDDEFKSVLENLKPHEKSCVLRYEDDVIKFEETTSSEQRRKLRRRMPSARKQENGSESGRKTKEKSRRIVQMDPDYFIFHKYSKVIDDHFAYDRSGVVRVVYELRNGGRSRVKEEADDGSYSDHVEIFDGTEKMNSKYRDMEEFRHKVISDLKRPFDEEEYGMLWRAIKHNLTKERHLELRCGRERPVGTPDKGKSYLDHYPVLKTKLLEAEGDRPKCLNLLRGFFLRIKQPEGDFCPWLDDECLATYPGPVSGDF